MFRSGGTLGIILIFLTQMCTKGLWTYVQSFGIICCPVSGLETSRQTGMTWEKVYITDPGLRRLTTDKHLSCWHWTQCVNYMGFLYFKHIIKVRFVKIYKTVKYKNDHQYTNDPEEINKSLKVQCVVLLGPGAICFYCLLPTKIHFLIVWKFHKTIFRIVLPILRNILRPWLRISVFQKMTSKFMTPIMFNLVDFTSEVCVFDCFINFYKACLN